MLCLRWVPHSSHPGVLTRQCSCRGLGDLLEVTSKVTWTSSSIQAFWRCCLIPPWNSPPSADLTPLYSTQSPANLLQLLSTLFLHLLLKWGYARAFISHSGLSAPPSMASPSPNRSPIRMNFLKFGLEASHFPSSTLSVILQLPLQVPILSAVRAPAAPAPALVSHSHA